MKVIDIPVHPGTKGMGLKIDTLKNAQKLFGL